MWLGLGRSGKVQESTGNLLSLEGNIAIGQINLASKAVFLQWVGALSEIPFRMCAHALFSKWQCTKTGFGDCTEDPGSNKAEQPPLWRQQARPIPPGARGYYGCTSTEKFGAALKNYVSPGLLGPRGFGKRLRAGTSLEPCTTLARQQREPFRILQGVTARGIKWNNWLEFDGKL